MKGKKEGRKIRKTGIRLEERKGDKKMGSRDVTMASVCVFVVLVVGPASVCVYILQL